MEHTEHPECPHEPVPTLEDIELVMKESGLDDLNSNLMILLGIALQHQNGRKKWINPPYVLMNYKVGEPVFIFDVEFGYPRYYSTARISNQEGIANALIWACAQGIREVQAWEERINNDY